MKRAHPGTAQTPACVLSVPQPRVPSGFSGSCAPRWVTRPAWLSCGVTPQSCGHRCQDTAASTAPFPAGLGDGSGPPSSGRPSPHRRDVTYPRAGVPASGSSLLGERPGRTAWSLPAPRDGRVVSDTGVQELGVCAVCALHFSFQNLASSQRRDPAGHTGGRGGARTSSGPAPIPQLPLFRLGAPEHTLSSEAQMCPVPDSTAVHATQARPCRVHPGPILLCPGLWSVIMGVGRRLEPLHFLEPRMTQKPSGALGAQCLGKVGFTPRWKGLGGAECVGQDLPFLPADDQAGPIRGPWVPVKLSWVCRGGADRVFWNEDRMLHLPMGGPGTPPPPPASCAG